MREILSYSKTRKSAATDSVVRLACGASSLDTTYINHQMKTTQGLVAGLNVFMLAYDKHVCASRAPWIKQMFVPLGLNNRLGPFGSNNRLGPLGLNNRLGPLDTTSNSGFLQTVFN